MKIKIGMNIIYQKRKDILARVIRESGKWFNLTAEGSNKEEEEEEEEEEGNFQSMICRTMTNVLGLSKTMCSQKT